MWTLILLISGAFVGLKAQNANRFAGHHFRVSGIMIPPYLYMVNTSSGPKLMGSHKEFMDFAFDPKLNTSYEFVFVDPREVKTVGFVNATINQLLTGQVDIASLGYVPTIERYRVMDFSVPATITQYVFIVPYPKEKSKLAGLVRPFQSTVWICMLVAFGLVVIVLSILTKYHDMGSTERQVSFVNRLIDNTIYLLTVLVGNGEYFHRKTLWLRLVVASWCLMCVVIINAYTGNLTSHLTIPAMESIPNSFKELAANPNLKLSVARNSILANTILKSSTEPFKTLGDQLRRNPENLYLSPENHRKKISPNNLAVPVLSTEANDAVNRELATHGRCTLTYSKPITDSQFYVFGLSKNGPYNQAFNNRFQYIWDMGFKQKWRTMFAKSADKCLPSKKETSKRSALKLSDLSGAFLLLAFGLILSLVVFLMELITGKRRKEDH